MRSRRSWPEFERYPPSSRTGDSREHPSPRQCPGMSPPTCSSHLGRLADLRTTARSREGVHGGKDMREQLGPSSSPTLLSHPRKKRKRGRRCCVRVGTDRENTPMFSKLPSHEVRQLVFGRPSDKVYPASLPHDGLTSAWGSEFRTASGRPDDRSPRVSHIPDAQRRDCSLAFAVLRGRQCAPLHPISLWKSAVLPLLGVATSVVSLKRLCSTASSANT